MEILNNLKVLLNKPFPEEESWLDTIKTSALFSIFILYFLYIFGPFGINELKSNKFLICLGFGAMTFIGLLLYEFLIREVLK